MPEDALLSTLNVKVHIHEVSDNLHSHSTVINIRPRTFFGQYKVLSLIDCTTPQNFTALSLGIYITMLYVYGDRPVIVVLPEEGPRTETLPNIDDS